MKRNINQNLLILLVVCILSLLVTNNELNKFNWELKHKFLQEKESAQGNEDDPYAAARFRWEVITGGRTDIDPISLRYTAIEKTEKELRSNNRLNKTDAISWSAVGPGNIGGRIRAIVINPSNSNEILVGSVSGGIWKTTNGGTTWSPKLDAQDPIAIGSMVLVGSSTVYAGTGEGWWNVDAVYGGGIYKSTNFGETWTLLPSTVGANIWNFRNVLRMTADPSGNIYAVTKAYNAKGGVGGYYTNGGLYRSNDGGTTWSKISSTSITAYYAGTDVIAISSSVILFSTDSDGLYRTTNSGTSWTKISSGLPAASFNRIAMAQDPNTSSIIYSVWSATTTGAPYYGLRGIYKSTDSGVTWSGLSAPPTLTSTSGLSYLSAQGWYDNVIAVDPYNSSHLYAGGVEMIKSTNGGISWFQLTFWHPFYGSPYLHADHHVIAFDPNNSGTIYSGNDGGIYKTTNNGTSWTSLNNGLEITQFYGGAVYPTGTTYYGGTQDNGHLKFSAGTNWNEVQGGDGGYAAQDQSNGSIAYEEYVYLQMDKTTDGGSSWSNCTTGLTDAGNSSACLFIAPFSINPENSNVLIAGSNRVWITSNSAGSWTASSGILVSGQKLSAVTVVNSSANFLGFAGTTDGRIFKCISLNPASGLDTWTEITPAGHNGAWVRRIVVDLTDKNKIYVCYSGFNNTGSGKHVWYSSNQGTSWTDISTALPDIPVHSLVVNPDIATTLYIGTETGVYSTTDRGTSWATFSNGMTSYVPIDELVLQTGTKKLFAFTHGRGVWETTTPLPVELSSFTAIVIQGVGIQLDWRTETEVNNYGFEIERSQKSIDKSQSEWEKIGFVDGNGNSNSPKEYSYTDEVIKYGNYAYRLKQIDTDGDFEYSKIIEVDAGNIPNGFVLEQNYPNPFNPITTITFAVAETQKAELKVFDLLGNEVATLFNGVADGGKIYESVFNAENFSSGIFFYRLAIKNKVENRKMLLIK
jgi:photosystem II stability/assembly factor-like uncharacterized protein